jgi:hypothetical protein
VKRRSVVIVATMTGCGRGGGSVSLGSRAAGSVDATRHSERALTGRSR